MRDEERTGSAARGNGAVPRERTLLGTGTSAYEEKARLMPIGGAAPRRERTVLGIAPPGGVRPARALAREASQVEPPVDGWDLPEVETRPRWQGQAANPTTRSETEGAEVPDRAPRVVRDPSVLVDLSEIEPAVSGSVAPQPGERELSLVPAGVPRRRKMRWLVALLVAALATAACYERRDTLLPIAKQWELRLMGTRPMAAVLRALRAVSLR